MLIMGRDCASVGADVVIWEIFIASSQCCSEPKTVPQKEMEDEGPSSSTRQKKKADFDFSFEQLLLCHKKYCYLVPKSCLTLCNPTNCCPPGSSVHEIL